MYEYNYEEPKPKNWWQKLKSEPDRLITFVIALLTFFLLDSIGIINTLNMNITQIVLLITILVLIYLWDFYNKRRMRKEISNAVDSRFEKIEDELHHIYNQRKISINNRLIQNDLNRIIAKSLSELEKDELENLLQKNQKNLIQHVVGDGKVTKDDAGNIVSEFMANRNYDPIKMRDH